MNRMEIEVLGTTFDARYERTSGIAETTLNSGSICVRTSRSRQAVRLRADERLVFNETTGSHDHRTGERLELQQLDTAHPDLLRHDARRHHHQPRTLVQRSDRAPTPRWTAPSVCRSTYATNRSKRPCRSSRSSRDCNTRSTASRPRSTPHEPPDQDNLKKPKSLWEFLLRDPRKKADAATSAPT